MSMLEDKLEVVRPEVFGKDESIAAWFTLKNDSLFSDYRQIPGLNLGFNTKEKEEVVRANRSLLFDTLDCDPEWIVYGNQVHGNRIQIVTQGGTYSETDGFITRVPGLALVIQVADCAAVLLGDPESRTVAALHVGWRGAAGGIIPKAVKYMVAERTEPKRIRAFVSPCISQQHFEVGREVADQFPDAFVDYTGYEKPHIDLKGFIMHQLLQKGLKPEHIEIHNGCTVDDERSYYSYRREGGLSGRMMGIVQLRD